MKKLCAIIALSIALCAGCGKDEETQVALSPSPTPAPTPSVTAAPTPSLPEVDPGLPSFAEVRLLAQEEWPPLCAMHFQHESGMAAQAQGQLVQGDGFSLYLIQGLKEKTFEDFLLEEGRVFPERSRLLDAGEGLRIARSSLDIAEALDALIAQSEQEGYYFSPREDLSDWDALYGFDLEPERGSIPYSGEFALGERDDGLVRRLFAMRSANGTRTVVMQVYEPIDQPPMFHYLCAMLASLRFQ